LQSIIFTDFLADKYSSLPHFDFKKFAMKLFSHSSVFSNIQDKCMNYLKDFSEYRKKIPVYGCALLNPDMTKLALACSWDGKTWYHIE
jgi:hypothetical protein